MLETIALLGDKGKGWTKNSPCDKCYAELPEIGNLAVWDLQEYLEMVIQRGEARLGHQEANGREGERLLGRVLVGRSNSLLISMTSYVELGDWLESRGIGYYFQSSDQMVISQENPAMPSSNCFWVTLLEVREWYIGTPWLPAAYRVPADEDIRQICESLFL